MAKESDAGTHDIQSSKTWEGVSFGDTFAAAPKVCAMTTTEAAVGKKLGVKDITTTGFSLYCEATGNVSWIAREAGFE